MELRDALRMLRSEIGLTQAELAAAVNVGFSAESRWENKGTRPNRASSAALLALAQKHRVSSACLDALTSILSASRADDRADRERLAQVTEQMKLEERVLLTAEQMKTTIDRMDLAVIVQRIRSATAGGVQVIYQNQRYAEIFGYSEEEFAKKCGKNIYFGISVESRDEYLRLLARLIGGKLPLSEFTMTLRAAKKGGEHIWLELKGINLTRYSYGWELFLSCRDVTKGVEAERNYAGEVVVREASLQGYYASFFCDLTANLMIRRRGLERVLPGEACGEDVDSALLALAETIAGEADRELFSRIFRRDSLLAAYDKKEAFGSARLFSTVARRWLRVEYTLIMNPYSKHLEAAVFLCDIQRQTLSERLMDIISEHFFEYIGLIDAELGSFEAYYYSPGADADGRRDYRAACEERLRRCADPREFEALLAASSLETVKSKLSQASFYTTLLRLRGRDGAASTKKVTYTYLDKTHAMIVVAQSDAGRLSALAGAGG